MPSPRTFIVHEYDKLEGIYAFRSGDWKLSWGKVGESRYIPDVDYPHARCTALLPPHPASAETAGAEEAHLLPWRHPEDRDLPATGGAAAPTGSGFGPKPPSPCPTKDEPCLFNVRAQLKRPAAMATACAIGRPVQRADRRCVAVRR
eukprot:SAG31_NODE_748_length_12390_cov_6.306484_4_plen_147_part_00